MNKKFTFMVAALLAAGGFSANAEVENVSFAKAVSGKYYHIIIDHNASSAADGNLNNDDVILGAFLTETSGVIEYKVDQKVTSNEIPEAAKTDAYLWKVSVKEKADKSKEVVLVNKATGYELAYNGTDLVKQVYEYENNPAIDKSLDLDVTSGEKLKFANGKLITVESSSSAALTLGNGSPVFLVDAANEDVEADELKNIGTGISINLEGTIKGEEIFNNVSVVTLTNVTEDEQFLLQVGSTTTTTYADMTSDEFKKAEFIVLTQKEVEGADVNATTGTGYTYAKVKGEKLVNATSGSTAVEDGKYPVQNGIFTAIKNANKEGKYAFKQASLMLPSSNNWTTVSGLAAYIGYDDCGVAGTATLTSAAEATWATVSGGTAVEIKNLVKGQWIVNILASDDKESTVMKRVVYAKQATTSGAMISGTADDTANNKDAIYAQWIVSANDDNTVTFINREAAGIKLENVTLFKTPKENVYSVSSATVESSNTDESSFNNLNQCYIELRTIENATQFDGFLKLAAEDVNSTEFTLGVDAGNKFEDIELPVIITSTAQYLTKAENKDADNAFTFKLAQATTKEGEETKLDTVFVNTVAYNYYKDGKLVEAKDTLKAISYVMTGLKNAGAQSDVANEVVTAAFELDDKDAKAGEFIFRKVGEQYQIAVNGNYGTTDMVKDASPNFTFSGNVSNAQAFMLNAIPVAPNFDVPESHIALEINGAYLGVKADGNGIMANDTSLLKSTNVDAAFSFWAYSADAKEVKTPSYYLASNGKMMYDAKAEIDAIEKEISELSPVFDAEKIAELKAKLDTYTNNGNKLVKFQQAKYVNAEEVILANDTLKTADELKAFKFNVFDVDGQAVLKNGNGQFVTVLNDAVVFKSNIEDAAKFNVVAADAPTSNEGVAATEVKVVANDGAVVVKNAAGKNVVVSTILGQVVANEVLTSDNATINVPAGIVVVSVDGESFKVNVR